MPAGKADSTEGGSPAPDELGRQRTLVGLLDAVPVFTLVGKGGGVFMRHDAESGERYVPWMVDGHFALQTLSLAHERGHTHARLTAQPLGATLASALGWATDADTPAASAPPVRLLSYAEGEAMFARALSGTLPSCLARGQNPTRGRAAEEAQVAYQSA